MQNNKNDDAVDFSLCPSFSAYFSDRQAVASRVVRETSSDSPPPQPEVDEERFGFSTQRFENRGSDADDEFEFEILCNDSFPDLETGDKYPIFNRDVEAAGSKSSLAKLFVDMKGDSSSSESDESAERGTGKCETSKSKGSMKTTFSKRWKLRDLFLSRSNSDGYNKNKKSSLVFSAPSPASASSSNWMSKTTASAHELFYVKNRAVKEEEERRRKSYLPYRSGLFGFCLFW